jgi:hypothetical protein
MANRCKRSSRFDNPWVTKIEPRGSFSLAVWFSDGAAGIADLTWTIHHDHYFKVFRRSGIPLPRRICRGQSVQWDQDRDLSAAALYRMAIGYDTPVWERAAQQYRAAQRLRRAAQ